MNTKVKWTAEQVDLVIGEFTTRHGEAIAMLREYASILREREQNAGEAVGVLSIRRFRNCDSMVNHDFDYYGGLADGDYRLYLHPAQAVSVPDDVLSNVVGALAVMGVSTPDNGDEIRRDTFRLINRLCHEAVKLACPIPSAPTAPVADETPSAFHGAAHHGCGGIWTDMYSSVPNAALRLLYVGEEDNTPRRYDGIMCDKCGMCIDAAPTAPAGEEEDHA